MTQFPTAEFWSVIDRNGTDVPLQTYAFNITTWGGDRQSVPPPRGTNVTLPHVPGQQGVPKVPDQRTMTLDMWVIGAQTDGTAPSSGTPRQEFNHNYAMLKRLLWNRQEPFSLVKRFFDESGTLWTAKATAEFAGGLSPTMTGRHRATFNVELLLADPFFYSDPVTIPFDSDDTPSWTGTVLGDYYSRRVSITGSATSLSGPSVEVSTDPVSTFVIDADGLSGVVAIDSPSQSAVVGSLQYAPNVTHDGFDDWLTLPPGDATINFDTVGGSWVGNLVYVPTWV